MASPGKALIIVENNSVPFDPRVWREARALQEVGWKVSIVCPESPQDNQLVAVGSSGGAYEVLNGIHIYRFSLEFADGGIGGYLREYISALLSCAKLSLRVWGEDNFDVLQVCNPPDLLFPLGLFYRLLGKKFIFDHHDLFPESISHRFSGTTGQLLHRLALVLEWLTFRTANIVISTNQSYRQIAVERGGINPERVFVVRNGPELASSKPLKPDPALKEDHQYLACYLGIMGAEDGIEQMMEAIRHVVYDLGRRDIQFVLIGDGPVRQHALSKTDEWNLEGQVYLPGRIPESDVHRYLSTADIGLSPDPYTPLNNLSTMNKIMEYMAFGVPVVSFDLKESRVSAGDAAIYVSYGDPKAFGKSIVSLLDQPARRDTMGNLGRQRIAEELAWEHQKEHLWAAYQAALE